MRSADQNSTERGENSGAGFRERGERGEEDLGPSKADTEDRWSRRAPSPDRRPSSSGFSERLSERRAFPLPAHPNVATRCHILVLRRRAEKMVLG